MYCCQCYIYLKICFEMSRIQQHIFWQRDHFHPDWLIFGKQILILLIGSLPIIYNYIYYFSHYAIGFEFVKFVANVYSSSINLPYPQSCFLELCPWRQNQSGILSFVQSEIKSKLTSIKTQAIREKKISEYVYLCISIKVPEKDRYFRHGYIPQWLLDF